MKQHHLLILAFLCTTACGAPFAAGDDQQAGDSGGDVVVGNDAGHDVDAGYAVDAAVVDAAVVDVVDAGHDDAHEDVVTVEASSGDSSDGAITCTFYPPTYYTFNGCSTVSSTSQSGFALPTTYALAVAGGNECVASMTPAACTCGDTYTCGCMMPALLAEQAAQTDSNILCAGTLSNCTADALGVIHVTCS